MPSRKIAANAFFLCVLSLISFAHAAEPAADAMQWQELFNGKDLSGWVVDGDSTYTENGETKPIWTIGEDGVIHCAGRIFGFLRYEKKLCDFEWSLEYRLAEAAKKKSNSGLGIRGGVYIAGKLQTRPSLAGYEIQLFDDAGETPGVHSTGSLYRYVAPTKDASRPAGEWNKIVIRCEGPRIRVTLNGEVIQDVDQSSIAEISSKPLCGYISLQDHISKVDFRNVRLRELPVKE